MRRLSDNARAELLSWAIALFAVLCLAMAGCGSISEQPARGVWVEDGITMVSGLAACDAWAPVGIDCRPAEMRETALVVIGDSHEVGCAPGGDDVVWAGQGGRDWTPGTRTDGLQAGWVHMHMGCYPIQGAEFVAALAHEFGHALGVPHVAAPGALMNAGGGQPPITTDDINAYWLANP